MTHKNFPLHPLFPPSFKLCPEYFKNIVNKKMDNLFTFAFPLCYNGFVAIYFDFFKEKIL